MSPQRYLRPGVVRVAAIITVTLAGLRAANILVPNWWVVGLLALAVACAYVQARVDSWAAGRRQR